jgi:hypothetical protein
MLKVTLDCDTGAVVEILKTAHDTEIPLLRYNGEGDLAAPVNLIYLSARNAYEVRREDRGGEGYCDFIFFPVDRSRTGFVIELKINDTPENAIAQIKKKNHVARFLPDIAGKTHYTGKALAVGLSYDRKTKEHFCKIETLRSALSEQR